MHEGVTGFQGLRITQDRGAAARWGIERSPCRNVNDLVLRGEAIGSGRNGGFQVFNLVVRAGAKKIILLGFDCSLRHGAHHHGRHPPGLNNPTQAGVDAWRGHMERAAPVVAALGVTVINAGGALSTIESYPKMTLEEALTYEPELSEQRQLHP